MHFCYLAFKSFSFSRALRVVSRRTQRVPFDVDAHEAMRKLFKNEADGFRLCAWWNEIAGALRAGLAFGQR
jgi:hypothetical protein